MSHFFESSPLIGDVQRSMATRTTTGRSRVKLGLILSGLVGALATAGAGVGLYIWHGSTVFHIPEADVTYGYTVRTFFGLLAFTGLSTMGFALLFNAVRMATLVFASRWWTFLLFLLANACIAVGILGGASWGSATLKCFAVFCVDADRYPADPNASSTGNGWAAWVGMSALIALSSVGLCIIHRLLIDRVGAFRSCATNDITTQSPSAASRSTVVELLIGAVTSAVVLLIGAVTLYLPDSFQTFSAPGIAANAMLLASPNATDCNDNYALYTCPEIDNAIFRTSNWRWSTNLVLKFYPANVMFYVYLLSLVAFASVVRANRRGRLFLKRDVLFGATIGELLLATWTVLMLALFFLYWVHDHNFNNNWLYGVTLTDSELWARSSGQLAVVILSLLFFPASRNSVLHRILGTSWEASLWAHRVLGYGVLGAVLAHMICWYRFYDINGMFPGAIFHIPMVTPIDWDNFTILLSSLAAWTLLLCMGVFALAPIRRRCFELFYYLHLFAAYFTIPAVLWHAASGWEYMLPGITVWFVDRIIRMSRSSRTVEIVDVLVHADAVTELRFRCASMRAAPGQYVFLCIPELSLFEWHPFTLSTASSLQGGLFTVHIRAMGEGTWTGRLLERARSGGAHASLSLAVDGPCGQPLQVDEYKRVVLCAGGIGVTPCASIYSFLKHRHDISAALIWSLRETELAHAFVNHFARDSVKGIGESSVRIFLTRAAGGASHSSSVLTSVDGPVLSEEVRSFRSRPSVAEEIARAAAEYQPDDVLVFACGPPEMMKDARNAARVAGVHFHSETFLL